MRQTRSVCCSGKTSGEALSYIILTKLASYGLDIQLMRGQRYGMMELVLYLGT